MQKALEVSSPKIEGAGGINRKKRRMEWWKKHKSDKSEETATNGDEAHPESDRPKLRNRDSIAKPDSLKYEPNYAKGFHAKILHSIYTEAAGKKKTKKFPVSASNASKRKSTHSATPITDKSKKAKPAEEAVESQTEIFDSYAFSLSLINGNMETAKAEAHKDSKNKYVLFIGNLPYDVTRSQLEEHFRKTGGVKSIRIPKERGSDMGKGFAYMEFDSRIGHGIALRLHQTTLGGRKINVEFTSIGGGKSEARKDKLKKKNQKRRNMKRH